MMSTAALTARLDVQRLALLEIYRALSPRAAAATAAGLQDAALALLKERGPLAEDADAAATGELAALLTALGVAVTVPSEQR